MFKPTKRRYVHKELLIWFIHIEDLTIWSLIHIVSSFTLKINAKNLRMKTVMWEKKRTNYNERDNNHTHSQTISVDTANE